MSQVKSITLKNGRSLFVEMEDADIPIMQSRVPTGGQDSDLLPGAEAVSFKEDVIDAFEVLRDSIASLADNVHESLKAHQPDEWSLELNIGFKGKVSPIPVILSGETSGGIKVTAKWKKPG